MAPSAATQSAAADGGAPIRASRAGSKGGGPGRGVAPAVAASGCVGAGREAAGGASGSFPGAARAAGSGTRGAAQLAAAQASAAAQRIARGASTARERDGMAVERTATRARAQRSFWRIGATRTAPWTARGAGARRDDGDAAVGRGSTREPICGIYSPGSMIETERLILRPWRDEDRDPFFEICRDPEVMAHLGPPARTRADTDPGVDRSMSLQAERGHCFWPIERKSDGVFLGFCGLKICTERCPVEGEIEIGWRLRRDAWGIGYAREAAEASLAWAWAHLDAPRIIAMTVMANTRSWRLMERLGMTRRPDLDFDHPRIDVGDPLRRHIVYVVDRPLA